MTAQSTLAGLLELILADVEVCDDKAVVHHHAGLPCTGFRSVDIQALFH